MELMFKMSRTNLFAKRSNQIRKMNLITIFFNEFFCKAAYRCWSYLLGLKVHTKPHCGCAIPDLAAAYTTSLDTYS